MNVLTHTEITFSALYGIGSATRGNSGELAYNKVQRVVVQCLVLHRKTTLDVWKELPGTLQQSPHLTTNADNVCSVRHIKLLSDIGIGEMCTVWPCQLDECKLQCSIAALHSQTHIKHNWHMLQVGSISQNTCNTIASKTVNSLLLKKPYSGRVQDSTKINVSYESAMSGEYIWAQRSHP